MFTSMMIQRINNKTNEKTKICKKLKSGTNGSFLGIFGNTSVVPKGYTPYTPYTLRKFQDNLGCTWYALKFSAELLNNSTPS